MLGALQFAHKTGQSLTDFFSDDSPQATKSEIEQGHANGVKRVSKITDEMRTALWSQPPSSTDKHIAEKLSLCIGMAVMIRHNYTTKICMTCGQEGFVHGWQSKRGLSGQLVLNTLFVKLKDPPSHVEVPGLPENVVPLYPTTTNIDAMLPNDEKLQVTRTQVKVLINFAMTDFASQGKTRPWNVCDLNNLRYHQSYYMALLRSATAEGTLILQGFDPKILTGRCSGVLRQEFRELEILDEITRLHHLRKLPLTVIGNTKNNLILAFRKWKGEQYVPHNVHPFIRWSKCSPWIESKVLSLDERLELLEKLRAKREAKKGEKKSASTGIVDSSHDSKPDKGKDTTAKRIQRRTSLQIRKCGSHPTDKNSSMNGETGLRLPALNKTSYHRQLLDIDDMAEGRKVKGNAAKRRHSSGLQAQGLRCASQVTSVPATRKQKSDENSLPSYAVHYEVPVGCRWSQNSCAYDTVFTSAFVLWCSDRQHWTENLKGMGNAVADLLVHSFSSYEKSEASLEDGHDSARHLIVRSTNGLPFGRYTSIANVSIHLLSTNKVVSERYYICPNGHHVHHSDDRVSVLSNRVHDQWVSAETHHTEAYCCICHHVVSIKLRFQYGPPLLVFSMAGSRTHINTSFDIVSIDNCVSMYTLLAIIYYTDQHFTAKIVTCDGRIWYYDGLALINPNIQPTLEEVGSIHCQPDLWICRGGQATAAIYAKV